MCISTGNADGRQLTGRVGSAPLTTLYRLLKAGCMEATWLMVQALRGVLLLPTHRSTSILPGSQGCKQVLYDTVGVNAGRRIGIPTCFSVRGSRRLTGKHG